MTPSSKSEPELETQSAATEGVGGVVEPVRDADAAPSPDPAGGPGDATPAAGPTGPSATSGATGDDDRPAAAATTPATVAMPHDGAATPGPDAITTPPAGPSPDGPATGTPAPAPLAATAPTTPVAFTPAGATTDDDDTDDDTDDDGDDDGPDDGALRSADRPDGYTTAFPLVGALVALAAVAALMLVALGLPAVKSGPEKLPIGVSGAANIQDQLSALFTNQDADTFDVRVFDQESVMRKAIEDREIYGGFSVSNEGASMLVSSAASTAAADALNGFASALSSQAQTQIPVRDVVALPEADREGRGLAAAGIPIVVTSFLPAMVAIAMYRRRLVAQVLTVAAAAVLVGLTLAAVLDLVLGTTDGSNFLLVAAGLAGGVLATSLLVLGLNAIGGRIAAVIGAAVLVLFAHPLSGLTTAPEWLPSPWGELGRLMPPGANATLLRSDAYFDGRGAGQALLVLGAWALIGLLLIGFGTLIHSNGGDDEAAPAGPDGPGGDEDESAPPADQQGGRTATTTA